MVKFDLKKSGDVLIVKVNLERATGSDSEVFKNEIEKFVNDGWIQIVVDMQKCHFVDSTFLSAILIYYKKVKSQGGSLVICSLNNDISSIIELTGMIKIFNVYATSKEAVASFKKSA